MPSSTGSIASRWLGFGGIDTTSSTSAPPSIMRDAPRWYLTSPLHCTPSSASETANRILELRQDLLVRLAEHVRHHVQAPAMRHGDERLPHAGFGRFANHFIEDGHEHVEPLDREPRLAGERSVQELLERLDVRQPLEQAARIDRIGRRLEPPRLDRVAQPAALLGHEDVREVVAGGGAVDRRAAARRRRPWTTRHWRPACRQASPAAREGRLRSAGATRRRAADRRRVGCRADRCARPGGRTGGWTAPG